MALVEYDLFGEKRDKVKTAIDRLQAFEPQEGYYVADSGGKDSTCVVKLCEMAGVKFDAHYHATTIDPPQLVRFIRKHHPATEIEKPEHTMRELIIKNQMPPTRLMRYCCEHLKELLGQGRDVFRGVRWAESGNRKKEPRACDVYNRDQRATQRSGFERCRAKSDGQRRNYPQHRQRREPQNG